GRSLSIERRRLGRDRLRPRCSFARRRGLWNGPFLNWPDGLAADPIEDIREALLGDLDNRFDRASIDADIRENWRRRRVEVPEVVMRQLKMPHAFAGVGFHADEGLAKQVVAEPVAAVHVAGG